MQRYSHHPMKVNQDRSDMKQLTSFNSKCIAHPCLQLNFWLCGTKTGNPLFT